MAAGSGKESRSVLQGGRKGACWRAPGAVAVPRTVAEPCPAPGRLLAVPPLALLEAAAMGSLVGTRANLVGEGEPVGHNQSRGKMKTTLFIEANALMRLILRVFVMKEFTSHTF